MIYIQKNWVSILTTTFLVLIVLAIILPFVLALQGLWNEGAWPAWTGFGEYIGPPIENNEEFRPPKTLWDLMQLLIVPLFLGFSAIWINKVIRDNESRRTAESEEIEQRRTTDQQREEALQHYLDKMSELLIEKDLLEKIKKGEDPILGVARGRTVSALRMLNKKRRNILFIFVRDADLANYVLKWSILPEADLEEALLYGFNLQRANLSKANLRGAYLRRAILMGADLEKANLEGADLRGAFLMGANLEGADLRVADLRGANLTRAKLEEAYLENAEYSDATKWPDDFYIENSGAIRKESQPGESAIMLDGNKHEQPSSDDK